MSIADVTHVLGLAIAADIARACGVTTVSVATESEPTTMKHVDAIRWGITTQPIDPRTIYVDQAREMREVLGPTSETAFLHLKQGVKNEIRSMFDDLRMELAIQRAIG